MEDMDMEDMDMDMMTIEKYGIVGGGVRHFKISQIVFKILTTFYTIFLAQLNIL